MSRSRMLLATVTLWLLMLAGYGCGGEQTAAPPVLEEENTPVGGASGARTLTFVNQCTDTVWIGATGGAGAACDPANACPTGQACSTDSTGICFWDLPTPTGNAHSNPWALNPNGGTATVTLQISADPSVEWSGNIFGRTQCDSAGKNCQTADCSDNPCPPGVGGTPPATLAEFTLLKDGQDTYDLSIINGINVPIEMAAMSDSSNTSNEYWCGNPGGSTPANANLKGCAWNVTPPTRHYQLVAAAGASCTSNGDCAAPEVCGLTATLGSETTCGALLGYWTADQACGVDSTYGAPFNCATAVPTANSPSDSAYLNLTHMYGCKVFTSVNGSTTLVAAQSCYDSSAMTTCCGCENWPGIPAKEQCQTQNSFWVTNVLPQIQFLKDACPMAYSYPYDDETSTFNCQTKGTTNSVDYTFTYCPN